MHSKPNYQLLQMCNLRVSAEDLTSSKPHKSKRVTFDLKRAKNETSVRARNCISLPPILSKVHFGSEEAEKRGNGNSHEKVCHSEKRSPEKEVEELSKCETVVMTPRRQVKTDNIGESLFSEAVLNCKFSYVKLQLQTGTSANMKNRLGQTPLMRCCFIQTANQRRQMFRLLLAFGADIETRDKSGKTVLHYAALLGRAELVGLVMNNSLCVDLNLLDRNGKSPLMYAVMSGSVDTCRYLVRALSHYGLSVDRTDVTGITPFIMAKTLGYTQIADILLYEGKANASQGDNKFHRCADEWVLLNSKLHKSRLKKTKVNSVTVLPPINTSKNTKSS